MLSSTTAKSWIYPNDQVLFILSTEKYFETLPTHNEGTFISESFSLYISTLLASCNCYFQYNANLRFFSLLLLSEND